MSTINNFNFKNEKNLNKKQPKGVFERIEALEQEIDGIKVIVSNLTKLEENENKATLEFLRGSFGEEKYSEIDINANGLVIDRGNIYVDGIRIDGEEE